MPYSFERIRDNLLTELKAKLLDDYIMCAYYLEQVTTRKKMTKSAAENALVLWTKQKIEHEEKLANYAKFDVTKLKDFEYEQSDDSQL